MLVTTGDLYVLHMFASALDIMSADEVRWTPYKLQEIRDCWFGYRQYIPAHPIRSQEAHMPANNRMYIMRNLFVEALWLEAPLHLLTKTWTSDLAIPLSAYTDDYMQWFLPHSHPRI
ncbi:hypothetical protein M9H77_01504 [Catharanthus roseus]|uniref:Uncharacterized protein n=1 Tax=Catharanthus roseus TaxID=4058 RepID=A0ACC0C5Z6_CATRO|nr:hypothetical protein M9H77_01504 [Catharanthus roseus]